MIILFDNNLHHPQTYFCGGVFQGRNERSRIRSTPFFLLLIFQSLLALPLGATTFGTIHTIPQAKEAPYVLHGRIGPVSVAIEPFSHRPHTYWEFQIIESLQGKALGSQILLRSPGGEIDGIGYQVASSASFREGEEVIVMAQDTRENPQTKEVFGLASGKYTVEIQNGKRVLRSGFGTILSWPEGQPLSLEEYKEIISQTQKRPPTQREMELHLDPPHLHEGALPAGLEKPDQDTHSAIHSDSHAIAEKTKSNDPAMENAHADSLVTDKSLGGMSSYSWMALLALIGLGSLLLAWKLRNRR